MKRCLAIISAIFQNHPAEHQVTQMQLMRLRVVYSPGKEPVSFATILRFSLKPSTLCDEVCYTPNSFMLHTA
jgi:hypothetical protein